jgi:membrane associated rhomboid family serine protease
MFPISDINPTRRLPVATYTLIGINVVVFLWQLTLNERELTRQYFEWAVVPELASAHPFSPETFLDVVRSMFFHGGWEHIIGNMLYLFLFGDNIEDRFGIIVYLLLYFIGGFVAAFAQIVIEPSSPIPLIGASGAIAAVLGSYLVLYPGVRVRALVLFGFFGRLAELPAWIVLGLWFVLQLISGFGSLGGAAEYGGGVAFFAHIGGFVAGVLLTLVLMGIFPQPPPDARREMLYQRRGY